MIGFRVLRPAGPHPQVFYPEGRHLCAGGVQSQNAQSHPTEVPVKHGGGDRTELPSGHIRAVRLHLPPERGQPARYSRRQKAGNRPGDDGSGTASSSAATRECLKRVPNPNEYESNLCAYSDQICYSVLCVFSYVAAGQDQKKNPVVITPQIQDIHAQQKQKHQQQQQKQQPHPSPQSHPGPSAVSTPPPVQAKPKPQAGSGGNISIRHTVPMQKPTITMSTVQPQARMPLQTVAPPPVAAAPPPPGKLPQLPPRVPSQPSTESLASISSPPPKLRTGPPPAIPPRTGAIARSGSVPAATRAFVRQASANSTPPQYTPQPPPPFVIPKRHGGGLARASTLSAAPAAASSGSPFGHAHPQAQQRASHGSVAASVLQSMPETEPGYGSGSGSGSSSGSGSAAGSIASASPLAHRKH
nr:MAP kinase-activating death domain protein-like [Drosophila bipectinata]